MMRKAALTTAVGTSGSDDKMTPLARNVVMAPDTNANAPAVVPCNTRAMITTTNASRTSNSIDADRPATAARKIHSNIAEDLEYGTSRWTLEVSVASTASESMGVAMTNRTPASCEHAGCRAVLVGRPR